ncbi:putative secreted protein [Peptoniphilus sp. ING2-D1G]|nr:putative secreted protein [Peptoniphilus sp. ING2-D1G]
MIKNVSFTKILYLSFFVLFVFSTAVYADMGPKPEIVVTVENFGFNTKIYPSSESENFRFDQDWADELDEDFVKEYKIMNRGNDGAPVMSDVKLKDDTLTYKLYYRVPENLRFVIVKDGEVRTSNFIDIKAFNEKLSLDLETMELKRDLPIFFLYILQFFKTFIPTILIELGVLILFGYSLEKNIKAFLVINLVTQGLLNVASTYIFLFGGLLALYLTILPLEIFVLIIESIYYKNNLVGQSKIRNISYGIFANISSFVAGMFIYTYPF